MINITVYDPRAINSPHRGTGFRSYDANKVEDLILALDFKTITPAEFLWKIDQFCARAYMPGFCYMADIYFSCGIKVLYAEGIDFIQHCSMWGKSLHSFNCVILKPGTIYDIRYIRKLLKDSTEILYQIGKTTLNFEDNTVDVFLSDSMCLIRAREDRLTIDFSDNPGQSTQDSKTEMTLHTGVVQANYPEELPKDSPGITSI